MLAAATTQSSGPSLGTQIWRRMRSRAGIGAQVHVIVGIASTGGELPMGAEGPVLAPCRDRCNFSAMHRCRGRSGWDCSKRRTSCCSPPTSTLGAASCRALRPDPSIYRSRGTAPAPRFGYAMMTFAPAWMNDEIALFILPFLAASVPIFCPLETKVRL